MRRNLLDQNGKVDRKAVLSVLGSYMFNYNTVESTLLFSAVRFQAYVAYSIRLTGRCHIHSLQIIVSLMGLMYTAQAAGSTYGQAELVITAVIMFDIILTILYFSTVLLVEVRFFLNLYCMPIAKTILLFCANVYVVQTA